MDLVCMEVKGTRNSGDSPKGVAQAEVGGSARSLWGSGAEEPADMQERGRGGASALPAEPGLAAATSSFLRRGQYRRVSGEPPEGTGRQSLRHLASSCGGVGWRDGSQGPREGAQERAPETPGPGLLPGLHQHSWGWVPRGHPAPLLSTVPPRHLAPRPAAAGLRAGSQGPAWAALLPLRRGGSEMGAPPPLGSVT